MNMPSFTFDRTFIFKALEESLAMISFDTQGNVMWANQNFADVMGYELHEIKGSHHSKFCLPEFSSSKRYEEFWDNLRKGITFHDKAERISRSGKILWLEAIYTPVVNDLGQVEGVVKVATDITNRQQLLQTSTTQFVSVVDKMTSYTNDVHYSSKQIVTDMDILNKESEIVKQNIEQIQSIISFVKEIASQSNLLGLNASIEAARAGEHGRGFSVVASEIRKMADSSKKSTEDISHQLIQMVSSVQVMMQLVENVTNKIAHNSNSIEELKIAYEDISRTADGLSKVI